MKRLCHFVFWIAALGLLSALAGAATSPAIVIERARAALGTPESLDQVVTLSLVGSLESANRSVPDALIEILARKPHSQRLEIRVDDMVETTIVDGRSGCMVRSNLNADASQMRRLSKVELDRVRYATRQLFEFFRPDIEGGEIVTYDGTFRYRGKEAHRLVYRYPNGHETIRYFCIESDKLVGYRSDSGVESVLIGEQIAGGIRYPERIEYFEDQVKLHSIVFREIRVNDPLPAGVFRIPQGQEK